MENPQRQIKEENRRLASEALSHLRPLLDDPHFAWFREQVLNKARDGERDGALSTSKTAKERARCVWRHALVKELCSEPERLLEMHTRVLAD